MRIATKLDFQFVSGVRLKLTDRAVARSLIGGGGGGVEYSYFRVMPE